MGRYEIAVIVGSLRRESYNQELAGMLIDAAPDDLVLHLVEIGDLPLYSQDDDENQPETVKRLRAKILESDGIIFVTPEYNRSIPGVLKNAIDHASRPYGASAWLGKPAGILGVSEGAMGTSLAQQHLRNILVSLGMPTLTLPEAFIQWTKGDFENAEKREVDINATLEGWLAAYVAWIRQHLPEKL